MPRLGAQTNFQTSGYASLFGTVAIQEYIQNSNDWTGYVFRIRTVVEEGTELLGMILILKAAMGNTKGILGRPPRALFPVFEVIGDLRLVILVGGFIGAIILAYLSLHLERHTIFSQKGQPTAWLASALFVLTALNVLRPALTNGRGVGWQGWAMAGLVGLACASTTLSAGSPTTLLLMLFLSAAACGLWILDPRYSARSYIPAMAIFAVIFLGAWLLRENDFVAYCMVQFVALVFFYVGSAPVATEAPPEALVHQAPGE
jgi:putative Ca2+/H+ antiporter (TMEM165/GDT1 family)